MKRMSALGKAVLIETEEMTGKSIRVPVDLSCDINPLITQVAGNLSPLQNAMAQLEAKLASYVFDFAPAQAYDARIDSLARKLFDTNLSAQTEAVPEAALMQIYRLFTIERERQIYRKFFAEPLPLAQSPCVDEHESMLKDFFL